MKYPKCSLANYRYAYQYFETGFAFKEPFYRLEDFKIYPFEVMNAALRSYIEIYPEDWKLLWGRIIFSRSIQQTATAFNLRQVEIKTRLVKFTTFIDQRIKDKQIGTFQKGWSSYKQSEKEEKLDRFNHRSIDLDSIQLETIDDVKRIGHKTLSELMGVDGTQIKIWIQRFLNLEQVHTETKKFMMRRKPVERECYCLTFDQAVTIAKKHRYQEIVDAVILELNYIFSKN